ncbi:hypothetical protein UPYG_G00066870 [Umbra pygmaea]|uniref:VWFA domain-containing protein n=1 Tax=Umbra pygmaea TaxID=75934 RepID=A0ABD0XSF4_UMBPY
MSRQGPISLFTWMVLMVVSSEAFNIDAVNTTIYKGEQVLFGYKVLQFSTGIEKGVMVSAPYQKNGSGGICKCVQGSKECFDPQGSNKYNGLSLAGPSSPEPSTNIPMFTACIPGLAHECDGNSYLNSICYEFNSQLKNFSNFTPAFQECTKKKVNLVFLFDGSGSMTANDFKQNKYFIKDIMNSLKNSSIEFAAVQFSTTTKIVFDFNDYQKERALKKLWDEPHLDDLTNTHAAINFTLKNIFDNRSAGATEKATKVLVIITDGDPSDTDTRFRSIKECNERNIIRFIIGVKVKDLGKLKTLASDPQDSNTFDIQEYNGLTGILDKFQKKIFSIEGSSTARVESLKKEMSQSGFSAIYQEDTLVLGSVGSNNWRGSINEIKTSEEREIQDSTLEKDSYMGYTVAVGKRKENILYFAGAPRSKHIGTLVVFSNVNKNWSATQNISGEQIGSYFGAELCSLDIDSDGNTDFLLVGAPLFHEPKREGRVYVYTLTDKLELMMVMNVLAPSRGRFGSSISSITDLNGDGLNDVAVGAPLEDNHSGAVYIYLGEKLTGIRPKFSQRIAANTMTPNLQYFGQTIDGKMDLGEDRLTDIVVGARGTVVVFRSLPVLNVSAHLNFHPLEISTDNFDCLASKDIISHVFTLTVCFKMAENTLRNAGAMEAGMNISYMLDVDPVRQRSRAFYSDKGNRSLLSTTELRKDQTCFNHSVYMTACVLDTLSPIIIKLNFSQNHQESPTAILNIDSPTQAVIEVPFAKNCQKNESCVADLEVDLNFVNSTLLVVENSYFVVTIRLSNHGDDSYNTSLTILHSSGLSFSMMSILKETRRTLFSCNDPENTLERTTCSVSLPVYRSKTTAEFTGKFHISNTYNWNSTMEMTVIGRSDNGNSTNSSLTKTIPVQFAVDLVAKDLPHESITYINFTREDISPKTLVNVYKVQNLGSKSLPITVVFTFPTMLEQNFKMKDYQISAIQNPTQCGNVLNSTTEFCSPDKYCKSIECDSFLLEKHTTVTFKLLGNVSFEGLKKFEENMSLAKLFTGDRGKVNFISFVKLNFDKKRYVQMANDQTDKGNSPNFHQTQIEVLFEVIIQPNKSVIIATGVVGGFLLLILITVAMYLMGCFKRKRPSDNEQEENTPQPMVEPENGTVDSKPLLGETPPVNNGVPSSTEKGGEGPEKPKDVFPVVPTSTE